MLEIDTNISQKFFPECNPDFIEEDFPIYPLFVPGTPPPGIDFCMHAEMLGDEPIVKRGKTTKIIGNEAGPYLKALYRAALYRHDFSMPVFDPDGRLKSVKFLPGHLWGSSNLGPYPAEVMVVGKNPGQEEIKQNRNFTGRTSQELIRGLRELEVNDEESSNWYVSNLIKFMPPGRQTPSLPANMVKSGLSLLYQELKLVQPKYLLCLGADAAKAVLGRHVKMADTIGQIYEINVQIGEQTHLIKVVCATHPAKVSREPELYARPEFLGSLRTFVGLIHGETVGAAETDLERFYIRTNLDLIHRVNEVIEETKEHAEIAIDCEWHGDYPWNPGAYLRTIQFSHKPKSATVIILRKQGGILEEHLDTDCIISQLNRLLKSTADRKVRLIGHNLKADLPWLLHLGDPNHRAGLSSGYMLDLRPEFEAPLNDLTTKPMTFGWRRTVTEGGFDTMLAAHAHTETGPFKLEILAAQHLGITRYDAPLIQWKKDYCKEKGIKLKDIEGYGDVEEEILLPYSAYDVDVTRRLFDVYNGTPDKVGLLDCDRFEKSCREAFWVSQSKTLAELEMEMNGISCNKDKVEAKIKNFQIAKSDLLTKFREAMRWEDFNPNSSFQRCEAMFGEKYNGKRRVNDQPVSVRPPGARTLNLTPIMTTEGRPWENSVSPGELPPVGVSPKSDKETLALLSYKTDIEEVRLLRNLRIAGHVLQTVLRPPTVPPDGSSEEPEYEKGILFYLGPDNKIRTHFYPVESGRVSSSNINLQNLGNKQETKYRSILGRSYDGPLRGVFTASPGCVLIEGDFSGAETAIMAWLSGDPQMMDHIRRSKLPESDPDYYDIISQLAVATFKLKCRPTKKEISNAGFDHLRTATKNRLYGLAYGQGDEAALRKCEEEGVKIDISEIRQVTEGIYNRYTYLRPFFTSCRGRVSNPGYMCNPYGRRRRFMFTTDRQRLADQEREALNWPEQSTVADALSTALSNMRIIRNVFPEIQFNLVLEIHDAIMVECPIACVPKVYNYVFPEAMTRRNPIFPCDLDGNPRGDGPYYLGIEKKIMLRWGEKIKPKEAEEIGLDLSLLQE